MNQLFTPADLLLPDFPHTDGTKWSVIACDQFTSEPAYWQQAEALVGDAPSTLRLMLPELYLGQDDPARIARINAEMARVLDGTLVSHPGAMIYLERTQSDGKIRRGIVGKIDLEAYDYRRGATSPVRATEGTVLERIPPRVAVRRDAPLELPHVMLLVDDPENTLFAPLMAHSADYRTAYDFDLMLGGGHVTGRFLDADAQAQVAHALAALADPALSADKYGLPGAAPLVFAVGDGNHSLASAKAAYEEIKAQLGEAALDHPARYALCEVVNLHDDALVFEPIYRVLFGVDPSDVITELKAYVSHQSNKPDNTQINQAINYVSAEDSGTVIFTRAPHRLTVGSLGLFLDAYLAAHPGARVDYIHGEDSTRALAAQPGAVGFLFAGMRKDELFRSVMCEGALPRKTFSMGEARDKRYYLECRRIR